MTDNLVRRFQNYAWLVLAYNVLVILWGAYVRATGSGAGCGSHWPLCNGEVIPREPQIATVIELVHRATSGLAMIAVVVLFAWAFRLFPRGHRARTAAALSLVFILVEALLGAGLVLLRYVGENQSAARAVYLAAHLANTLVLLAFLAAAAWLAKTESAPRLRFPRYAVASLCMVMLIATTGAVAALGDTLFPSSSVAAGVQQDFAPGAHGLIRLRIVHPVIAVIGAIFLIIAGAFATTSAASKKEKVLAWHVLGLTLVQVTVGGINMALLAPVWLQIVHLLIADSLWISLVLLSLAQAERSSN